MHRASRSPGASAARSAVRVQLAAVALTVALACGGDGGEPRAEIFGEPQDQVVFEGGVALFEVFASGTSGVRYQWRRNGVSVPGATDSHLAVEAGPDDDGATYSVLVTNTGADPVESRRALLTVHPPLDLRFKRVVAPFIRDFIGDSVGCMVATRLTFTPATASPLKLGNVIGFRCDWHFPVFLAPGIEAIYESGHFTFLDEPGGTWGQPLPSGVFVSIDLHDQAETYAFSFNQAPQRGEFAPVVRGTVASDELQALASAEGEAGRVLTAVFLRGSVVSYVSQGWSLAGSTTYEAKVALATSATAGAEAERLAAEGYALTAFGDGEDGSYGPLVLVGTRARGESTPVPVRVISSPDLPWDSFPGWAMVGTFEVDVGETWPSVTWILER